MDTIGWEVYRKKKETRGECEAAESVLGEGAMSGGPTAVPRLLSPSSRAELLCRALGSEGGRTL